MKQYEQFNEIREDVKANAPKTVYKFRTWENDRHKVIIAKNELWFAHPFTLNDPYDVRPPYNFKLDHVNWSAVKAQIRYAGRKEEPNLPPAELEVEVEKRYQAFVVDPISYFGANRADLVQDEARFNPWGILSCCMSAENEAMWAYYGNNHQGFAVGFDTLVLSEALSCAFGKVDYSDEPLDYYIMGNNEELLGKELFRKSIKWAQEEEFRFATAGVGIYRDRLAVFPPNAVTEIVFGINTSDVVVKEIREIAKVNFPGVAFYRVARKTSGYGLTKLKI